jgi:hypothetical protein
MLVQSGKPHMDPIVETLDDLKKVLLSLKPGQRGGLNHDAYAVLFPPGERPDDARRACFAFAAAAGCTIDNKPEDQVIWFVKNP